MNYILTASAYNIAEYIHFMKLLNKKKNISVVYEEKPIIGDLIGYCEDTSLTLNDELSTTLNDELSTTSCKKCLLLEKYCDNCKNHNKLKEQKGSIINV